VRPLPFASRVVLASLAAMLAVAGLAAAAAWWLPSPWAVLLAAVGVGVPLGWWLVRRVLTPAAQVLGALRDGVRGFQDHDFSLSLAVDRSDELGELVALYNRIGDVLREERRSLIQREMLLETVLESTPTAIVLSQGGRVIFSNRSARELFDAGAGRLEGHSFERTLDQCPAALREALESGRDALLSVEGTGREDAEVFHVGRRSFELNGRRHDLIMIQRLTQELRRQEVEVWKRAIRTISHEINNSLAPIASLARSARRIAEAPEHRERLAPALDIIEERSAHLRDFLEGYARFARLPAPRKQEVDWAPFLADLRRLFPFVLDRDPPSSPARFDPSQVQQALINLLKNAQESGSPPEAIHLAVEETAEGGVRLRVLDRGSGMSEEELKKALLPFYSSKSSGSGLGLPLCREIVEAHGGHLRIERREGGGTAVVCWLPGA
jgi:nitrogen fixation/metabolism regulation signal transduction histidine kinase